MFTNLQNTFPTKQKQTAIMAIVAGLHDQLKKTKILYYLFIYLLQSYYLFIYFALPELIIHYLIN